MLPAHLAAFYEWYHNQESNRGALLDYERTAFLAGWEAHRQMILRKAAET